MKNRIGIVGSIFLALGSVAYGADPGVNVSLVVTEGLTSTKDHGVVAV
jgi:hypothetical protein